MKKIVSLLLCVALLCSMLVVAAQADDALAADFADVVIAAGGAGTIEMNLTDNTGLASLKFAISDDDKLGVTYAGVDATGGALGLTANDKKGIYYWVGSENYEDTAFGELTISVPATAKAGEYTFTVVTSEGYDENGDPVALEGTTFTVTVIEPTITGVNVAIDADISIGIHTNAALPITAVDVEGESYYTLSAADCEEDGEGGYVFYLKVSPWAMGSEYTVDFTSKFDIKDELLNLDAIPETARVTGILNYCEAVKGTSDELDQLIADLLEFGRQAQRYQLDDRTAEEKDPENENYKEFEYSYDLPEGLAATEGDWVADEQTFGEFCADNYAESNQVSNETASKKFKITEAKIDFGTKFIVKFKFENNGTTTVFSKLRVGIGSDKATKISVSADAETGDYLYTYAFSPVEYDGVAFYVWTNGNTAGSGNSNLGWIDTYGPAFFAAYVQNTWLEDEEKGESAAALLDVLEAFYNYGVSLEAYIG